MNVCWQYWWVGQGMDSPRGMPGPPLACCVTLDKSLPSLGLGLEGLQRQIFSEPLMVTKGCLNIQEVILLPVWEGTRLASKASLGFPVCLLKNGPGPRRHPELHCSRIDNREGILPHLRERIFTNPWGCP